MNRVGGNLASRHFPRYISRSAPSYKYVVVILRNFSGWKRVLALVVACFVVAMLRNTWQTPRPGRPVAGPLPAERVQDDVVPLPAATRVDEIPGPETEPSEPPSPPPSPRSWKQRILDGETDELPSPPPPAPKTGLRILVLDEKWVPVAGARMTAFGNPRGNEATPDLRASDVDEPTQQALFEYQYGNVANPFLMDLDRIPWDLEAPQDPPLSVELHVEAQGYLPHTGTRHTLRPGRIDAITIQLTPSPGLRILVRDAITGLPIAGADVLVLGPSVALSGPIKAKQDEPKQDEPKIDEHCLSASGRTDAGGRIVFRDLPRIFGTLHVAARGFLSCHFAIVSPDDEREIWLHPDPRSFTCSLQVTVLDTRGVPWEGATVTSNGEKFNDDRWSATTDSRGVCRLENLPAGEHSVFFSVKSVIQPAVGRLIDKGGGIKEYESVSPAILDPRVECAEGEEIDYTSATLVLEAGESADVTLRMERLRIPAVVEPTQLAEIRPSSSRDLEDSAAEWIPMGGASVRVCGPGGFTPPGVSVVWRSLNPQQGIEAPAASSHSLSGEHRGDRCLRYVSGWDLLPGPGMLTVSAPGMWTQTVRVEITVKSSVEVEVELQASHDRL